MGTTSEGVFILTPPSYPRGIILGDESQPHQTIYEESSTQKYTLGTQLIYGNDGRKFRYAKNGGVALTRAYMTQAAANTANCVEELQTTSGADVDAGNQEIIVDVTAASGITANLYAEGWMVVNKSTGIGDIYKIVACELITTTTARLLLETTIRTALSATTEITLVRNRWRDVVVYPTSATQVAAGVPLIDVTIDYFAWLQTGGPAPLYVDAGDTIVLGNLVGQPGTAGAAGTVGVPTAGTLDVWGTVMYVATGGEVALINLTLD